MTDGAQRPSWGMRVAAPLAFFVAATVLVLLVQDALNAGNEVASPATETQPTTSARPAPARTGTGTGAAGTRPQRRFYVIRTGDTLETIAARYGTTVEDLVELNPNIDPNALQPGQRIRVR